MADLKKSIFTAYILPPPPPQAKSCIVRFRVVWSGCSWTWRSLRSFPTWAILRFYGGSTDSNSALQKRALLSPSVTPVSMQLLQATKGQFPALLHRCRSHSHILHPRPEYDLEICIPACSLNCKHVVSAYFWFQLVSLTFWRSFVCSQLEMLCISLPLRVVCMKFCATLDLRPAKD